MSQQPDDANQDQVKLRVTEEANQGEKAPVVATSGLTVQNFLSKCGDQTLLLEKRDSHIGGFKWVGLLIFCYFLISPIFPFLAQPSNDAYVLAFLLVPLSLLIWMYIEYYARSEIWYICACRGILVQLEKTDTLKKWACTLPMLFLWFFMLVVAVLIYFSINEDSVGIKILEACLFLLGILFMLGLVKAYVDIEGSNRILSVNMFLFYLGNNKLLESQGYKVVHYTKLQEYVTSRTPEAKFSWNEIFALDDQPAQVGRSLSWGCKLAGRLRPVKDQND